ncbi:MAG: acylphosphatase [Brooklawnia sp.]|jgi:acylphosphatase
MGFVEIRAVQVQVIGRVQGVGFRWTTQQQATALGVHGWVRNRPDGSVEAWLEGPGQAVAAMLEWLEQGPAYAVVRELKVVEGEPAGLHRFVVRRG